MQINNISKNTILSRDLKEAKSVIDKIFGLLIKTNPRSLLFKTRFGIHTFFLKEPIDVLVLNSNQEVVKASTIKPNSLFFYNPTYDTVLELPKNSIKDAQTKIGDKIEFLESKG